jgi:hypothetical protein
MKFTLVSLVVLLVVILTVSYYANEEGFQSISNANTATIKIQPKQGSLQDLCYKATDKEATVRVEQSACPPGSKLPYQINKLTSLNTPSECSFVRQPNISPDSTRWNATYMGDCNNEPTYWKTVPNVPAAPTPSPSQSPSTKPSKSAMAASSYAKASAPTPAAKVEVSDTAYESMNKNQRSQLLKDIQKIIRNEMLSERSVSKPSVSSSTRSNKADDDDEDDEDDECDTNLTSQGKDYMKNNLKTNKEDSEAGCPPGKDGLCPPLPDMRDYIRKDKIPCWGCSIDY